MEKVLKNNWFIISIFHLLDRWWEDRWSFFLIETCKILEKCGRRFIFLLQRQAPVVSNIYKFLHFTSHEIYGLTLKLMSKIKVLLRFCHGEMVEWFKWVEENLSMYDSSNENTLRKRSTFYLKQIFNKEISKDIGYLRCWFMFH